METIEKLNPARLMSVHLYCKDCNAEMTSQYRDKIFKVAPYLYTCTKCSRTQKGFIHYPYPRFVLGGGND